AKGNRSRFRQPKTARRSCTGGGRKKAAAHNTLSSFDWRETMSQMDDRPVTLSTYPFELLHFRRFGPVGPAVQMTLIAALYVATTLLLARDVRLTGKMMGYDPDVWILFVPITEEILFRGLILGALEIAYGPVRAVVVTSLLFGLWHLKNVFWLTDYQLIHQM